MDTHTRLRLLVDWPREARSRTLPGSSSGWEWSINSFRSPRVVWTREIVAREHTTWTMPWIPFHGKHWIYIVYASIRIYIIALEAKDLIDLCTWSWDRIW
jgi:hypothetical protein